MVHASTGDACLIEELEAAVLASKEDIGLSNDLKIGLAKSCLENNKEEAASEVIMEVMRNAPNPEPRQQSHERVRERRQRSSR